MCGVSVSLHMNYYLGIHHLNSKLVHDCKIVKKNYHLICRFHPIQISVRQQKILYQNCWQKILMIGIILKMPFIIRLLAIISKLANRNDLFNNILFF
jgi:hypothetical protein